MAKKASKVTGMTTKEKRGMRAHVAANPKAELNCFFERGSGDRLVLTSYLIRNPATGLEVSAAA